MDYRAHYDALISRSPKGRRSGEYRERHHVIPRCLGGDDQPSNIVYLTPEEHYVAHQLLVKIHPQSFELAYAATMMCKHPNGKRASNKLYGWLKRRSGKLRSQRQKGIPLCDKAYEEARRKLKGVPLSSRHVEKIRAAKMGELNPMYGKARTTEQRELVSKSVKSSMTEEHSLQRSENAKRNWNNPDYRAIMIAAHKGRKNSEDTKRRMAEAAKASWARRKGT